MTTKELRLLLNKVVGDIPVVIAYDYETPIGVRRAYAGIEARNITIEPELALKPISRDTPMKLLRTDYQLKKQKVSLKRCPVCDNRLRTKAKFCDICGQAVYE